VQICYITLKKNKNVEYTYSNDIRKEHIPCPPKSRITRQMILDASLQTVREEGIQALNVRSIAARLHCSTQPIMYHFSTMQDLKNEIYTIANERHMNYIMNVDLETHPNPCVAIGKNYIQFAVEEPHLFRFLFQSDRFVNNRLRYVLDNDILTPAFVNMAEKAGLSAEEARVAYASTFFALHGAASLMANNSLNYDAAYCDRILEAVFCGAVNYIKSGSKIAREE